MPPFLFAYYYILNSSRSIDRDSMSHRPCTVVRVCCFTDYSRKSDRSYYHCYFSVSIIIYQQASTMSLVLLPNEILFSIAGLLEYCWHINSFVQVNRHLHGALNPYLYYHNIKYLDSSALRWAAKHGKRDHCASLPGCMARQPSRCKRVWSQEGTGIGRDEGFQHSDEATSGERS